MANPVAEAVISYLPGTRFLNLYVPSGFAVKLSVWPVAKLLRERVALGITAPAAEVTVPETIVSGNCASEERIASIESIQMGAPARKIRRQVPVA